MEEQTPGSEREGLVQARLRWQDTAGLPTLYANQVYITHAGTEFYVVFGEVQLPVLVNVRPEDIGELEVKPVAKLVFTPEAIIPIVEAMADNLRSFQRRGEK